MTEKDKNKYPFERSNLLTPVKYVCEEVEAYYNANGPGRLLYTGTYIHISVAAHPALRWLQWGCHACAERLNTTGRLG